ncbi:MAG: nucleotide exchange factor GrpE [Deltaproteobacteria bacterium]|nr:nucleotide exchange factor GrpE [Deltaproteobacteria bacterium]
MAKKDLLDVEDKVELSFKKVERAEVAPKEKTVPEEATVTEPPSGGEAVDLATELAAKEEEAKSNYDRLLRVSAEFENFRRRSEREKVENIKFANEEIIKKLLPIVDNLERAVDHAGNEGMPDNLMAGIVLTLNELNGLLEKFGVKSVSAVGEKFDPQFHEAIAQEVNNTQEDNTVVKEYERGYLLHDRLIRPAKVVVSKRVSTN